MSKMVLCIIFVLNFSGGIFAQEEMAVNAVVEQEAFDLESGELYLDEDHSEPLGFEEEFDELEDDLDGGLGKRPADEEGEGNVTLDFHEADIRNVLRILAYKSGINIVPGPDVTGLVTIQLADVPWKQALDVILENYGYSYEQKGNVIMVTTIENLKKRREDAQVLAEQEPLETQSFILNFAKASKVIESVDKLKTGRGSVHYDERTNTILVKDTKSNMELIRKIIKKLDATTPQVLIESRIVETTLNNSDKLGIDWQAQIDATGATRPSTWPFKDSSSNDYLPGAFPTASGFTYGTIDFNSLTATLEMLRSRTDTNILSNPRIVTLDNQKASISVGSQYPMPQYTYNEDQARLQVSGWEYMDIGIIFDVTPQVNNAGFVTLAIAPKITDILDYVTVEGTSLPRLSNESVTTEVMVKSGDTLVIAGLIKDKKTQLKKKIPLIGDIPFLGLIFTKTEDTIEKTDLIIFITPHVITPEIPANF